jgi:hypothetical protein
MHARVLWPAAFCPPWQALSSQFLKKIFLYVGIELWQGSNGGFG